MLFLLAILPARAASLLVISIDGMRSGYIMQAGAHGMKLPGFQRLRAGGSYAEGVRAVVPSISWPGHATLMTGVWPAQHGIFSNNRFDPMDSDHATVYWYARDVKAETLWEAAAKAGMATANVNWLSTVGSPFVRYDIPYFAPFTPYDSPDNLKAVEAVSRPANLLPELEARLGPYYDTGFEDGDRIRTRFAVEIMRRYKPHFMTVHLSAVDNNGHRYGPFAPQANHALETEDGLIGQLRAAALANDPDAVVAVVSDHGMAPITHSLNLRVPLVKAGLIRIAQPVPGHAVKVIDWKADIWSGGGSAAIMLKNPADAAVRAEVAQLLHRLAADPANGINRVVEGADIRKLGGWPGADFVIDLKPGTAMGPDYIGNLVVSHPLTGTHGFFPDHPEMYASFFIIGKGIKPGQDLGIIDMRRIAPTLAQVLGVTLKDAKQPPLPVFVAQSGHP